MKHRKRIREKGKIRLSKAFQEFRGGDRVCLVHDLSQKNGFPKQFHGLTGVIEGKRGRAYIVRFKNGKVYKKLVIRPIHLKKLRG
ncbi:MAG: 50S ribosomal protein L21e [Candidatus Pacearchaeota archaeon]|nr:MAG: 50S ribosomal protein L21e [Candidatus Pacearchaeota archaeon]